MGDMMVFPGNQVGRKPTINVARGFHPKISDRMDLTVECVRRYYRREDSPLARPCAADPGRAGPPGDPGRAEADVEPPRQAYRRSYVRPASWDVSLAGQSPSLSCWKLAVSGALPSWILYRPLVANDRSPVYQAICVGSARDGWEMRKSAGSPPPAGTADGRGWEHC